MNRKTQVNLHHDGLDRLADPALAHLKKTSPFFNEALLSAQDRDEIAEAMRAKACKPIRFRDTGDEAPPEARVNAMELCAQFYAVWQARDSREKDLYRRVLVQHQIATQAERRRLAEWNKRSEHLEPLLQPVHFQIYAKRCKFAMLREGEMGQAELLQSRLVLSHFEPQALYARDLTQQVEHFLSVSLVRLILHQGLLLLLFEWEEVQHFALVLGFAVQMRSEAAQKLCAARVVELERPDLLEYQEPEVAPRQDDVSEGAQLGEVKRALQGAFVSYITAGYVKRDSGDAT